MTQILDDIGPAVIALLGLGVVVLISGKTQDGASVVSDAVTDALGETVTTIQSVQSVIRGIRNNNPGNVRKSSETWQGLSPTQTDPAFFQFRSMPYGVRAMVKILRTYSSRYNLNTVAGIIARWAPPNENDTGAYVRYVAQSVGVATGQPIDLDDADTIFELVRAIIAQENGRVAALLVTDAQVWQGIELT